jgi:protein PhnA
MEVKDCNGNLLKDGDTVSVIKDLKVLGSSSIIKSVARWQKISA